jgi:Kef-type K+ transport system membrane component KefB
MSFFAQAAPVPGLPGPTVLAFVLLDIVIILITARLVGALFTRIGQPRVVGEIVAGVLLGPTLLGPTIFEWSNPPNFLQCDVSMQAPGSPEAMSITSCVFPQQATSVLGIIGQIALILFMFLVGLELDWTLLVGKGRAIGVVAIGVVLFPLGLAFAITPFLFDVRWVGAGEPSRLAFTLMIGAMLSVTAFPVMARILQEKGLTNTLMGSVGIAAAAVVTVLMFLLVAMASGVAAEQATSEQLKRFGGAAALIAVMFAVVRPVLSRWLAPRVEEAGEMSTDVFAGLIIFMFASAYVADRIGINVIPGAFLAGAVLPSRRILFRDLKQRLADLTAVILLPIFLAFSGLQTDFTSLGAAFVTGIVVFLAAAVIGKWLGGAVSARLGGMSWTEGNLIGILMNCRGLLVLVVGLIAFNQGVISAQMQVAGVLMALVTTAMTGPLFDRFRSSVPELREPPSARVGDEVVPL